MQSMTASKRLERIGAGKVKLAETLGVRVPQDIHDYIANQAAADDRKPAYIARKLICEAVEARKGVAK